MVRGETMAVPSSTKKCIDSKVSINKDIML